MSNPTDLHTSVCSTIDVDVPIGHAFAVFTGDMASWWPPEHHILDGELAEMVVEPWAGGRIFDRGVDGSECHWAQVLAFEPPELLAFSWNISTAWQIEPDPARRSEVLVRFTEVGPGRTRVVLEHRHLDRHGDGWEQMRDAVGTGWGYQLTRFAAAAEGRPIPTD